MAGACRLPDAKTARQQFPHRSLDYKALDEAVARRSIELLITNTGHYTELEATGQVSRIATGWSPPGRAAQPFYGTAIALASRNDLAHYRDLKGQRLLIPEKSSLGGWQVHVREALAQGIRSGKGGRQPARNGKPRAVVAWVLAGQAMPALSAPT